MATGTTTRNAVFDFVSGSTWSDVPQPVQTIATQCVLDLVGVAAAGRTTELSALVHDHAVRYFAAGDGTRPARLLFDGRHASVVGAALAGASTIDSFDAHDGHVLTKGHAGVAVLPATLALVDALEADVSGAELLAAVIIGYEIALRAGIALHATAPDYHTSGAWNALGVAAVAARLWGLDDETFRHALGIAEYHGPRSQMMRCIDHPTMLKDGSGWGAAAGTSAACLAVDGFTGAPASLVENEEVAEVWRDLGERWRIGEMYFKPYPVCRWAQPAVEAALAAAAGLRHDEIERIRVETFAAAARLAHPEPATTEEAQYSLPFPVAAALVHGTLRPDHIVGAALEDPHVLALAQRVELAVVPELEAEFPAKRRARVAIELRDGRVVESATLPARGDAEAPLSQGELREKFTALAEPLLGSRTTEVAESIEQLPDAPSVLPLLDRLLTSREHGGRWR